jgi:hypothetical protein
LWDAVITEEFDIPKVIPLLFENTMVPEVCNWVPADAATPPPPAPADTERLSPVALLENVPEALVPKNEGVPWVWETAGAAV